ncbi:hypothetical protein D3C83_283800 [compost metagenome]
MPYGSSGCGIMSSRIGTWPAPYTAMDDVKTKHFTSCFTDSLIRLTLPITLLL